MNCKNCNSEISSGSKFCQSCGALIGSNIPKGSQESYQASQPSLKKTENARVSLDDCLKADETAVGLLHWSDNLKKWGKILGIVILIIGFAASIITSISLSPYDEFEFQSFFISFIDYVINAFIIYAVFYATSMLVSALGKIVQNTKNHAKLLEYQINQAECSKQRE